MELSLPFPRRAPARTGSGRRRSRGTRPGASLGTRVRYALERLRSQRLVLWTTICAVLAVPLLGGGWLWLRNSSLVAVRHVHITGVHGVEAIEIREALDHAATRMTTMNLSTGALRAAVSSFAIVGGLHVTTHFPHTVTISVSERPPVAVLLSAGQRTAVAADGTVLGPALLSSSLPTVNGSVEPPAGERLRAPTAVAAVTVLGAAPSAIARFVVRAYNGPEGLTVAMRNGLLVYFGDATRPHAKWLSLARVLTSPSSAGAAYVDVRLPERPAAGFSSFSSASPSTSSALAPVEPGTSADPTTAALAASLEKAAGGGAAASTSTGSSGSESPTGAPTSSGSGESETSSGSSTASGESESSPGSTEASESPGG